jgi:hypothetical protein
MVFLLLNGLLMTQGAGQTTQKIPSFRLAGTLVRESEGKMFVRFNWEPADGALKYHLVVADDPDFKSKEIQKILIDNSVELTLTPEKTYYWRVGALGRGYKVWNQAGPKTVLVPALTASRPREVVPRGKAVIDGKVPSKGWEKAVQFDLSQFPIGNKADLEKCPECRLMWDDESLYIQATIWFPKGYKISTQEKPRDSLIHLFDSLEIFIFGPGRSKGYHLIVNASDSIYDDYSGDVNWNGDWKHAVGVYETHWMLEIAIPFAVINETPSVGSEWKAEFHANLKCQGLVPTWSTRQPPFGKIEGFGTLILGK